ncbi:hypothetical protein Q7A53_16610 [Halobacillus rhizosphaerae]|uniref:hypothetical protein n=1 Tax=Halobacillus rhizosphaerae TaxID=3064889 RepID=UPI00398B4D8D
MKRDSRGTAKRNYIPAAISFILYMIFENSIESVVHRYVTNAFTVHVVMIVIFIVILLLPWYIVRKIVESM